MDKFLQSVNVHKIMGKSFTKNGTKYTILVAQKEENGLYLAIADIGPSMFVLGKDSVIEDIRKYIQSGEKLKNYEGTNLWSITPLVLKVDHSFLRMIDKENGNNIHLFRTVYNCTQKIFNYMPCTSANSDIFSDPFSKNGTPITNINLLKFKKEEVALRKILADAMPTDVKEEYIKEFNKFCYKAMLKRNMLEATDKKVKKVKNAMNKYNEITK